MKFLVDSICGLNPAPVARRTSDVIRDAAAALSEKFDLRQYFAANTAARSDEQFFKTHFAEQDPILLQAQAGLPDAVRQLQRMAEQQP